ncbi:hypothetical protein [Cryobacterium inferilacus]|nr:hypothetical protein [Cryobacterium sp. 1639]
MLLGVRLVVATFALNVPTRSGTRLEPIFPVVIVNAGRRPDRAYT